MLVNAQQFPAAALFQGIGFLAIGIAGIAWMCWLAWGDSKEAREADRRRAQSLTDAERRAAAEWEAYKQSTGWRDS